MKIKAYTTIKESVGNVIPGTTEIMEAQTMEDKGSYYSVVIHANREIQYSKKYWKVERM